MADAILVKFIFLRPNLKSASSGPMVFLLYNLLFLGSKLRLNSSVVRIPAFWT